MDSRFFGIGDYHGLVYKVRLWVFGAEGMCREWYRAEWWMGDCDLRREDMVLVLVVVRGIFLELVVLAMGSGWEVRGCLDGICRWGCMWLVLGIGLELELGGLE